MTKYDIYGDGTIIDVTNHDFLTLLAQFAENYANLANSYIVNHVSGLADFDNEYFKAELDRAKRQYLIASEGIKDDMLREKMSDLIRLLEKLNNTDVEIVVAYRNALVKNVDEVNHKSGLKKKVYKHLYKKHIPPPSIVVQLAQESAQVIPEFKKLQQIIVNRIEQLMALEQE